MMILYEQGKWLPSDLIAKFISEFAHLKVFKGVDADGKMILVDPDHTPTMRSRSFEAAMAATTKTRNNIGLILQVNAASGQMW